MDDNSKKPLLILLHGVGANGADLEPVGEILAEQLPGLAFESPNAPNRSPIGPGFQWFSVAGVTVENRPDRVLAARNAFDSVIASLVAKHGLQDHLERVVFLGFSQGSIMGLDAIASGRWPVAGLVALSGRLVAIGTPTPTKTPVLLLHGSADPVIPASETLAAEKALLTMGVSAESKIYPGLGHTISQQGLVDARNFLAKVLA